MAHPPGTHAKRTGPAAAVICTRLPQACELSSATAATIIDRRRANPYVTAPRCPPRDVRTGMTPCTVAFLDERAAVLLRRPGAGPDCIGWFEDLRSPDPVQRPVGMDSPPTPRGK